MYPAVCVWSIDNCTEGDVRLVDGNSNSEGRVEVCREGVWGTINYLNWDETEARVICQQLGFFQYSEWSIIHTHVLFSLSYHVLLLSPLPPFSLLSLPLSISLSLSLSLSLFLSLSLSFSSWHTTYQQLLWSRLWSSGIWTGQLWQEWRHPQWLYQISAQHLWRCHPFQGCRCQLLSERCGLQILLCMCTASTVNSLNAWTPLASLLTVLVIEVSWFQRQYDLACCSDVSSLRECAYMYMYIHVYCMFILFI